MTDSDDGTTVTVEVETEPAEPVVIDEGDTVVVTPAAPEPTHGDAVLERVMAHDQLLNSLADAQEKLAESIARNSEATVAVAEAVSDTREDIDDVQAELADDDLDDTITPTKTHPWFRTFNDWRHNS